MSSYVTENDVPAQVAGFVLEELDGELLIFDSASGRIVEVNETAALIWQLCDGKRSLAELSELISATYPEAEETIKQDIPRVMQQLVSLGVLYLLPKKSA